MRFQHRQMAPVAWMQAWQRLADWATMLHQLVVQYATAIRSRQRGRVACASDNHPMVANALLNNSPTVASRSSHRRFQTKKRLVLRPKTSTTIKSSVQNGTPVQCSSAYYQLEGFNTKCSYDRRSRRQLMKLRKRLQLLLQQVLVANVVETRKSLAKKLGISTSQTIRLCRFAEVNLSHHRHQVNNAKFTAAILAAHWCNPHVSYFCLARKVGTYPARVKKVLSSIK